MRIPRTGDARAVRQVPYAEPMNAQELERRVAEIAESDVSLESLCLTLDDLLRSALPYVVAAWSSHDPATGLFTSCTMTGIEKDLDREARLFELDFRDEEPASFISMIAEGRRSAILSEITGGRLEQAARYRELLAPFGVSDELRAVFSLDDRPWGSVTLYRQVGVFRRSESELLERLSVPVARAFRHAMLWNAVPDPTGGALPPGVLQVHADGRVDAITVPASDWITRGGAALLTAVQAVASAARAGMTESRSSSRIRLSDGRLAALEAARTVQGSSDVAVIVMDARPVAVSDLLLDTYDLTPRQGAVLGLQLRGLASSAIARELEISEHTVHDHQKQIYRKFAVSGRAQLAARLQAEWYSPYLHRRAHPNPLGGFYR